MKNILLTAFFVLGSLASCSSGDDGVSCPSPWLCPDAQGRVTEGDLSTAGPEMIIVTAASLEEPWREYATLRTLHGVYTEVVLMETVVAEAEGRDDAERLRNYLRGIYDLGSLRFVLLGGDADIVPFRRVENHITIALTGETYDSNAPSQLYFANLEADFDGDGDGVWGERDEDFSVEESRVTQVAVGRIPVETASELARYMDKYDEYTAVVSDRMLYPLLLSDIAVSTTTLGDIDGAEGIEPTVSAFFPETFKANARRLYATAEAAEKYDGEVLTYMKLQNALIDGYGFLFHNGHGSHESLANSIDVGVVKAFMNEDPFVMLTCACLAGNFADVDEGFTPQGADDDSAAEIMMYDFNGSIAYVGNTSVGLGPWGGSQFLHAMTRAIFVDRVDSIGEAFNVGRAELSSIDYSIPSVPSAFLTVTEEHEWWTQHVLILLGDPALRVITQPRRETILAAPSTYGPGWQTMIVTVKDDAGVAVEGAAVTLLKEGDFVLRAVTDAAGQATFSFIPSGRSIMEIGVSGAGLFPSTANISPEG